MEEINCKEIIIDERKENVSSRERGLTMDLSQHLIYEVDISNQHEFSGMNFDSGNCENIYGCNTMRSAIQLSPGTSILFPNEECDMQTSVSTYNHDDTNSTDIHTPISESLDFATDKTSTEEMSNMTINNSGSCFCLPTEYINNGVVMINNPNHEMQPFILCLHKIQSPSSSLIIQPQLPLPDQVSELSNQSIFLQCSISLPSTDSFSSNLSTAPISFNSVLPGNSGCTLTRHSDIKLCRNTNKVHDSSGELTESISCEVNKLYDIKKCSSVERCNGQDLNSVKHQENITKFENWPLTQDQYPLMSSNTINSQLKMNNQSNQEPCILQCSDEQTVLLFPQALTVLDQLSSLENSNDSKVITSGNIENEDEVLPDNYNYKSQKKASHGSAQGNSDTNSSAGSHINNSSGSQQDLEQILSKRRRLTLMKVADEQQFCQFCGKKFNRLTDFINHTRSMHSHESKDEYIGSGKPLVSSITIKTVSENKMLNSRSDDSGVCDSSHQDTAKSCGALTHTNRLNLHSNSILDRDSRNTFSINSHDDEHSDISIVCSHLENSNYVIAEDASSSKYTTVYIPVESNTLKLKEISNANYELSSNHEIISSDIANSSGIVTTYTNLSHRTASSHENYSLLPDSLNCPSDISLMTMSHNYSNNLNCTHPCLTKSLSKTQSETSQNKTIVCPDCSYSCYTYTDFESHRRVHSNELPYMCSICSKRFKHKRFLKRHETSHLSNDEVCSICLKEFNDSRALQAHIVTHTGQRPYSCSTCGKSYSWLAALNRHRLIHEPGYVHMSYVCETCGKSFTNSHSLLRHTRLHTGERPFKCEQCGRGFIERRTLNFHLRQHTGERPHQCTECGKRYARAEGLKLHLQTHVGKESRFVCPECKRTCSSKAALTFHIRLHSGDRPFSCDECSRSFPSISSLRKHAIRHIDSRPFACEICDKSFKEKYVLQVHMRTHMDGQPNDKQYRCQVCHRGFRQSCTLTVHMRRHTGEKPYICKVCGVSFTTTSSLHRHERIHTGACPYTCQYCHKKFRLSSSCKSHILRSHSNSSSPPQSAS